MTLAPASRLQPLVTGLLSLQSMAFDLGRHRQTLAEGLRPLASSLQPQVTLAPVSRLQPPVTGLSPPDQPPHDLSHRARQPDPSDHIPRPPDRSPLPPKSTQAGPAWVTLTIEPDSPTGWRPEAGGRRPDAAVTRVQSPSEAQGHVLVSPPRVTLAIAASNRAVFQISPQVTLFGWP